MLPTAAIPLLSPGTATAQSPAVEEELTEVLVSTARQREDRLIDVPVAVSTIGAKDRERSGLTGLESATQFVPQVNITMEAGGPGVSAAIRGVRTPSTEVGLNQSAIFNVDGGRLPAAESLRKASSTSPSSGGTIRTSRRWLAAPPRRRHPQSW